MARVSLMELRKFVPWWMRIGAKIVLSRLPIPYGFWKRFRLFEHGDMNKPQRALEIFLTHAQTAGVLADGLSDAELPRLKVPSGGEFSVLELGPGDSLFIAVIAKTLGATHTWMVDAGDFATRDRAAYAGLLDYLQEKGYTPPPVSPADRLEEILSVCKAEYLTEGVDALSRLPDHSVDFCFSNAVLEHVPKDDFRKLVDEFRRVLKPGGVCVHRVDLKDHLGGGLNNLRFSEITWEGMLFRKSGFYTNRLRFLDILKLFERAGFECQLPRIVRWERLPISRSVLAAPFRRLPDDDLLVSGFDVVLSIPRNECVPELPSSNVKRIG